MSFWTERSSAEVGSSRTTSRGGRIIARAIAMRWRWPPENSCGKRLRPAGSSRTSAKACAARRSRSRREIAGSCTKSPPGTIPPPGQRRLVHEKPLGDDLARGHARRQRAVGVLEDDLELAPQGPHRGAVEGREV